jgi:hypothetical protein
VYPQHGRAFDGFYNRLAARARLMRALQQIGPGAGTRIGRPSRPCNNHSARYYRWFKVKTASIVEQRTRRVSEFPGIFVALGAICDIGAPRPCRIVKDRITDDRDLGLGSPGHQQVEHWQEALFQMVCI